MKIEKIDYPLMALEQMERDGDLDPQPDYQRGYVFDDVKASKLVESIFLDIPVPSIYLNQESDGTFSIIDGQQRIKSFLRYLKNEFALVKLDKRKDLNGKRYKDLLKEQQSKIKNYRIVTYVLEDDETNSVKYEIFERLNQGSVKLNPQELRNCVYRGSFNAMLKELATNKRVLKLIRIKDNKRMDIEENLLKFFAFSNIQDYRNGQKGTLDSYMNLHKNDGPELINRYKELLLKTFDTITEVLGEHAFDGITTRMEGERVVVTKSSQFSATFYDSISIAFSTFNRNVLMKNADKIRAAMEDLKMKDLAYREMCYGASGSKDKVFGRIQRVRNTIANIVGENAVSSEPRVFDRDLKQTLFERQNHICPLCGNEIVDLDSAEIDHIIPYSKGGTTTLDNASLVHSYCNKKKSDTVIVPGVEADPTYDELELNRFKFFSHVYNISSSLMLIGKVPDGRECYTIIGIPGLNAWLEVTIINKSKAVDLRIWTTNPYFNELLNNKECLDDAVGFESEVRERKGYSGLFYTFEGINVNAMDDAFFNEFKAQLQEVVEVLSTLNIKKTDNSIEEPNQSSDPDEEW